MPERSIEDLARVILRQEREAVTAALREALTAFAVLRTGSPRAADAEWLRREPHGDELDGLLGFAANDVATLLRAADEQVRAIEVVLNADEMLPLPAMTLARAVHEAVVYVCWLTDAALTPAERVARAAAIALATAQGGHEVLPVIPSDTAEEAARVREGFTGLQKLVERWGVTVTRPKESEYASSVTYAGHKVPLKINATAASERYTPGTHYLWVTGSGATHARGWFTRGLDGPWENIVVMVTMPLLDLSDALIDAIHGYVGLDAGPLHVRTHVRRTVLIERFRPGEAMAAYEEYAAKRDRRR